MPRCTFCGTQINALTTSNMHYCTCVGAKEYQRLWNETKDLESAHAKKEQELELHSKQEHKTIRDMQLRDAIFRAGTDTGLIRDWKDVDRFIKIMNMENKLSNVDDSDDVGGSCPI
jgi:hypothetical protein